MSRQAWTSAARRVLAGERGGILCPENEDEFLVVTWLPSPDQGGEYHLHCPGCGAEVYVLKRLPDVDAVPSVAPQDQMD